MKVRDAHSAFSDGLLQVGSCWKPSSALQGGSQAAAEQSHPQHMEQNFGGDEMNGNFYDRFQGQFSLKKKKLKMSAQLSFVSIFCNIQTIFQPQTCFSDFLF